MVFQKKKPPRRYRAFYKNKKNRVIEGILAFIKIFLQSKTDGFFGTFSVFLFLYFPILIFSIFFKFCLFCRILMRVNSIFYVYQFYGAGAPICDEVLLSIKIPQNQQHCLVFHIFFLFFHLTIKITIFFNLFAYRSLCQKMNILTCVKQHEAPLPTAQFCPQCISLFRQKIINFPS